MRTLSTIAAVLTATALAACVPQDNTEVHPVGRAIPTAEQVQIKLPNSGASRAIGDIAPWYVATRDVTRTLNGGTGWVLILVHTIVQFPVTSVSGNTATWGPWSDALDPAEYKLEVAEQANGSYDYALSGRNKTVAGASFEVVISGNALPGAADGQGTGNFAIDFDAAERVNPIDNDAAGQVEVVYDLAARQLDMGIDGVEDRAGVPTPVHFDYAYAEAADGAGDMVFAIHADSEDEGALAEDAVIRSRWQADGAGRADLRISGGDLGAVVGTASECWGTDFRRSFYEESYNPAATEGDASACAFADQDLPPL